MCRWSWGLAIGASVTLLATACQREVRPFQDLTVASDRAQRPTLSSISPGSPSPAPAPAFSPYQNNAYATGEGKRLFDAFNCSGCHAHGGGGMGPPLMDDEWIYGSQPANIFETIVEGRPNGMPSFRNKIADQQVWELVAYVQSMSGQEPIDVLPSRSDHMRYSTPENARRAEVPKQTGTP
ncbi:MAG TPA: c-type cytochrome [Vicinamibacterales bacterium]|nr:c-type cytochrome [Vicinamibacterales bacterium]